MRQTFRFLSFSCRSALTPAYSRLLLLTPTHSRWCWCTNIDGRMTEADFSTDTKASSAVAQIHSWIHNINICPLTWTCWRSRRIRYRWSFHTFLSPCYSNSWEMQTCSSLHPYSSCTRKSAYTHVQSYNSLYYEVPWLTPMAKVNFKLTDRKLFPLLKHPLQGKCSHLFDCELKYHLEIWPPHGPTCLGWLHTLPDAESKGYSK